MARLAMRTLVVTLVVLSLAGCECDASNPIDGGPSDGGGEPTAIDAGSSDAGLIDTGIVENDAASDAGPACETLGVDVILDRIAEATCARSRLCATYYSPARADSCDEAGHDAFYADDLAALSDGYLRFDAGRACQCIAELREPRCHPPNDVPIVCYHMFVPTRDGPCVSAAHCGRGACFRPDDECPGACWTPGDIGEPCATFESCATGLACRDGICDLGGGPGEPCASQYDCRADLGCPAPESGPRVCGTPPSEGEPCDRDSVCGAGLVCDGPGLDCVRGAAEGEACGDTHLCALGLRCAAGQCAAIAAPGAPCVSDGQCPAHFTCEGTCVPLPLLGEPCVERCRSGACADGLCTPLPDGATCDPHRTLLRQCEGSCDRARGVCAPNARLGERCSFVSCEAGLDCSTASHTCIAGCVP